MRCSDAKPRRRGDGFLFPRTSETGCFSGLARASFVFVCCPSERGGQQKEIGSATCAPAGTDVAQGTRGL